MVAIRKQAAPTSSSLMFIETTNMSTKAEKKSWNQNILWNNIFRKYYFFSDLYQLIPGNIPPIAWPPIWAPIYDKGNFPAIPKVPPWKIAELEFIKTTKHKMVYKNKVCQASELANARALTMPNNKITKLKDTWK